MPCENNTNKEKPFAKARMGPTLVAPPPVRLMTIPSEVRLEIYDIYFAIPSYNDNPGIPQRFRDPTAKTETGLIRSLWDRLEVQSDDFDSRRETSNLNLLVVSKLIHAEAIPRFYHHHLFSLPSYCSPVVASSWTGLPFRPPKLRLEHMRHFDLIRKLELVHQHLGNVFADRHFTDRAISHLLQILVAKCTSLRYLSIRVMSNFKEEYRLFCDQEKARGGDYPYLDFRRQTPKVLQLLMPRLDRLEIHLMDSGRTEEVRTGTRKPTECTSTWGWRSPDEQQKTRSAQTTFFSVPSAETSPEDMKLARERDLTYCLASLEPFAHFSDPEMDRRNSDDVVGRCQTPGRT